MTILSHSQAHNGYILKISRQRLEFDLFLWNINGLCDDGGEFSSEILLLEVDIEFEVVGNAGNSGVFKKESEFIVGRLGLGLYFCHRYK